MYFISPQCPLQDEIPQTGWPEPQKRFLSSGGQGPRSRRGQGRLLPRLSATRWHCLFSGGHCGGGLGPALVTSLTLKCPFPAPSPTQPHGGLGLLHMNLGGQKRAKFSPHYLLASHILQYVRYTQTHKHHTFSPGRDYKEASKPALCGMRGHLKLSPPPLST